jgi:glycosyltransferase involved in cell wall biosynthesis
MDGGPARDSAGSVPLRICIVYDCLYPFTVGGAQRWYRDLAVEMAAAGNRVTYVTRRQWDGPDPDIPGLTVVTVSPFDDLYDQTGRRRIGPPVRFGLGVLGYFGRHRTTYDVVHTCSFPYFSVIALRCALAGSGTRLGVDWFEYWSDEYWSGYLGPAKGRIAAAVQRLCARLTPLAFVTSPRHSRRLQGAGVGGQVVPLGGLYAGARHPADPARRAPPVVLFVGRLIPEKQADLIGPVIARVRTVHPSVRGLVIGDGPARRAVEQAIDAAGVADFVTLAGFVDGVEVDRAMRSAACLLVPSRREGFGQVVIEAIAAGTPPVVVDGPDNAAADLVEPGFNGHIAPSADPDDVARAVIAVLDGGEDLRRRTVAWFEKHEDDLRIEQACGRVLDTYRGLAKPARR